jgi:hypothetical protein
MQGTLRGRASSLGSEVPVDCLGTDAIESLNHFLVQNRPLEIRPVVIKIPDVQGSRIRWRDKDMRKRQILRIPSQPQSKSSDATSARLIETRPSSPRDLSCPAREPAIMPSGAQAHLPRDNWAPVRRFAQEQAGEEANAR